VLELLLYLLTHASLPCLSREEAALLPYRWVTQGFHTGFMVVPRLHAMNYLHICVLSKLPPPIEGQEGCPWRALAAAFVARNLYYIGDVLVAGGRRPIDQAFSVAWEQLKSLMDPPALDPAVQWWMDKPLDEVVSALLPHCLVGQDPRVLTALSVLTPRLCEVALGTAESQPEFSASVLMAVSACYIQIVQQDGGVAVPLPRIQSLVDLVRAYSVVSRSKYTDAMCLALVKHLPLLCTTLEDQRASAKSVLALVTKWQDQDMVFVGLNLAGVPTTWTGLEHFASGEDVALVPVFVRALAGLARVRASSIPRPATIISVVDVSAPPLFEQWLAVVTAKQKAWDLVAVEMTVMCFFNMVKLWCTGRHGASDALSGEIAFQIASVIHSDGLDLTLLQRWPRLQSLVAQYL
jgi:hypothetical protein